MQLAEGKTTPSGSFKESKPICFAGRRNGRSVVSLLGSMKRQCTTRETSKPPGCLGTLLAKLTTPKGDDKKLDRAGQEIRKKSKIDARYSKLSVEDRLYLKSQLAIWFPFIVHHPTLSELETALAEMGARILRNMAAFQMMDMNSTLTESKEQRRLYRKRHQRLTPSDLKILLSPSPLDKRGVDKCVEVGASAEGKPSHNLHPLPKLRHFHKTETSNSFINAEKNWRHNLMSEQAMKCSELPKKIEKPDININANQLRLLQLYDRQNYNVPGWFYQLLELESIIDLELMNKVELLEVTPEEVNSLACPPRRISLHMVPTGSSSFVKGHLFVSVVEQERVMPTGDDCKDVLPAEDECKDVTPAEDDCKDISTNNKMPNLEKSFGRRKLPLPKNISSISLSSKRQRNKPSENVDKASNDFSRDSSSQDDFFPKERSLSFYHNWAHVSPTLEYKRNESRWKRKNRQRSRNRDKCTFGKSECSNDVESNHSVSSEHKGYEAVQQDSKDKITDSILTPTQTSDGSTVKKDALGRRRLFAKIRKLLGETGRNDTTLRTSSGKVCENDDVANMISSSQTCVNRPSQNLTARCKLNEHSLPVSLNVHFPESSHNTAIKNAKAKEENVQNDIYKERLLVGSSFKNNKNVSNLSAGERSVAITTHTYLNKTITLSPGRRLQEKSLSERRSKRRKRAVHFKKRELMANTLDNTSLNGSSAYFVSDILSDDLHSAKSTDSHCRLNTSQNSNTEYEEGSQRALTKRRFQMRPTCYRKTKRGSSLTNNSFKRRGKDDYKMPKARDYSDFVTICQNALARPKSNYHLHKAKMEDSSTPSFSDSFLGSTLSNDAIRGSVKSFVREQWRSGNINSISSASSNDKSDVQKSYGGQSSSAESETSPTKERVNIRQKRYQNAAQHRYINTNVGYRSLIRPACRSSLWSSEKRREKTSSKPRDTVKRHNPDSNAVNGDVMTGMYQDFEKEVQTRVKSSGHESGRGRATAGPCANVESEFNGNNENLLTNVASTSTSGLHKFTTASATNEPPGLGAYCSPTGSSGRHQSANESQSWMTLKDLSSLLAYCSRILSTNEPLTEGTIEILKAVDETLSWYFIEDDYGHRPQDKSKFQVTGPIQGQREKEMPKRTLGLKHQDCRDIHTSRHKTKSNKARLTKWPDCVNLSARMTDEPPNYIAPTSASSRYLDETQNKLDSDQDDPQATRVHVGSDTENHMRQELDEPGSWQLHQRNSEGADRPQQGSRHELLPPPHTYLNDSLSAVLSPYDDWPKQVYQSKAPVSMPDPSEFEQPAKNATQKRQYFEQKIGHQTSNEPTHIKQRCAQNTTLEATGCSPIADYPESGRAFRQKRSQDTNCQRFSLNRTNSYKPCVSHPSMCCNKTTSCSENHCGWNNSSPVTSKSYYPSHCLDCLDRIDCCGCMRKESCRKPHFTVSHGCHRRHGLCDFTSRLQSDIVHRIPSIPRRRFDFPGHKYCFPTAPTLRPCWQSIGDMTSEFEKRFGFPEETVPMRKVSISENLSMYADELTEPNCGFDNSPAFMKYVNLVPNPKKKRACVNQPFVDHRTDCCKEKLESETIEYIKELLRACIARENHEDNAFNLCLNNGDRIKTCKLSDDDRQLFESLKCKLDSKLLQSLLKPDDCRKTVTMSNQTTQCDARDKIPKDCPCQKKDQADSQCKTRGPCCMCRIQESKPACKPETIRMHSKGLQADMSWAPGKSRETSSQTCKDFDERACLPLDNGTCSVKPAHFCECADLFAEDSPCENERLVTAGCRVTPKAYQSCAESDQRPRCAVIEDISSCTHQGGASAKRADKRNKSLQTKLVRRLSPPCVRCVPRPREESCSVCMSHSEIYPKLSPERVSMPASSRGCIERDQCRVRRKLRNEHDTSGPTCGTRPYDRSSFYVKKWEYPLEGSPLTSYLTDCIGKSRKTYNAPDRATFVPTTRKRPPCVFNSDIDKCSKIETRPLKSAWADCGQSKAKDKEQQPNEPCAKESTDADRPIVHIRYKSKKASGKSEITVDSIPCNEDQITSPVRNLALELKKHVQKIIQNSKELKQQALNADKCPKAGENIRQESDAKTPSSNNPPEVVRFHSSRKDDGSWSYVMKIKSPVLRKPEEMSESYASKNVNCGNNNFGDTDSELKSVYGVKIDVTLPETYVNNDTEMLIHEVLPEILKIALCAILKMGSNGVEGQCGSGVKSSRKQKKGPHENVNCNACSDDTVRDPGDCYDSQTSQGNDSFPRPKQKESFQKITPRRLPRRGNMTSFQASVENNRHGNDSSFDKSERNSTPIRPHNNDRSRHEVEIDCLHHRCNASSIRRKNKSSLKGSVRSSPFDKTCLSQTEVCLESQPGHPLMSKDLKGISVKDGEEAIGCGQICQHEVFNKGHTVIIEDLSSLDQSSSESRHINARGLCHCNCEQKSRNSRGARNLKLDKQVRTSEKSVQSSGWVRTTEGRTSAPLLTCRRRSRDTNTSTSDYVPRHLGVVHSHPYVVMECYDSTREFTTITPTESRDDTLHQAFAKRHEEDGDQRFVAKAEHTKGSRSLPLSKKMGNGETPSQHASHCCPTQIDQGPSAGCRVTPKAYQKLQFVKSFDKVKRSISDDSADSCHGIEDLPVDSGVSGTLIKNTTETGTKRNAEAANVVANRGKRSFREANPSAKTSQWNSSEPDTRNSCRSMRALNNSSSSPLVDENETVEQPQEHTTTSINKALIELWNSPNEVEDTKDKHTALDQDPELSIPTYRRSEGCKLPVIMSNQRKVSTVLGGNVRMNKFRRWVECKDSATMTDNLMTCDKSIGVRDTKIRKPVFVIPKSPSVYVRKDAAVELNEATKWSPDVKEHSSEVKLHLRPRPDSITKTTLDEQPWQNVFVGSAELTEATSHRVVLEGAFYKSRQPGDGPVGQTEMCSSFLPQSSTFLLPFRLVLLTSGDGTDTISGTYLRRMVATDRFLKWNINFSMPEGIPSYDMVC